MIAALALFDPNTEAFLRTGAEITYAQRDQGQKTRPTE